MKNLSLYVNLSNYSPFDTLRFKMLILRWKLLKATVIRVILSLEESRVPVLLALDEPVCLREPRLFHYSEFANRCPRCTCSLHLERPCFSAGEIMRLSRDSACHCSRSVCSDLTSNSPRPRENNSASSFCSQIHRDQVDER